MTGRSRRAPSSASASDLHRAWLELVDTEGAFLSVPVLRRVWEQGMPQLDADEAAALKEARPAFEKAWEEWDAGCQDGNGEENAAVLDRYRDARDRWIDVVLREVVGWRSAYRTDVPGAPVVRSPDHAVSVGPSGALVVGDAAAALVLVVDPVDTLRDPLDDSWATSPIDRMEELLRAAKVPIGVVTDGRWWAVVSAQDEIMVASGIVDAQTWIEEPATRNAFVELLRRKRLSGGKPEERLATLFRDSVTAAEEITEALGVQVRRAVELLVQALSEGALDAVRRGEPEPLPERRGEVYEAAVTVLMRVVFLLFAEERGLLPQSRLFTAGYGITGELDALDARQREEGSEALDATSLTWHRLLATSQALYRGASFEDLRLPSYGGSLFDPARFPFLLARSSADALALPVSDRVLLEVLRAVQVARLKGEPARRISFRDIDVEQIGYIYEGLLGYSCEPVGEVTVGLVGRPGEEPEMTLAELEELAAAHPDPARLADAILASVKESQRAAKPASRAELAKRIRTAGEVEDAERALRAVTTSPGLRDRLRPFVGIIRRDLRGRPLVVERGGVLVVETPSRATAGAHYTPRKLATEVVQYALEPLVYDPGPHDEPDPAKWTPVSSDRILDLKVADIACGSGAFLVAAARYLAARLVAAWHREGVAHGTPHGLHTKAVRKVVATCLYGADINAMAVEMCKLSLWLVSLDSRLPFSFVDDKVLHGNSLLGLTDQRQLKTLHIDPAAASPQMKLTDLDVDGVLKRAISLRHQLASEVDDADPARSAATKRRQWAEYQKLTAQLTDVADGVVAAGLRLGGKPGKALREAYENLAEAVRLAYPADGGEPDRTMLDAILDAGLTPTEPTDYERWKPLHWVLQVPDVMERGGFDTIVGNPPFRGGQYLTDDLGTNVRNWLVNVLAEGRRGSVDIVVYFFLRAASLLTALGNLGLIGTNSIAQGVARGVGLDQMNSDGFTITRAVQSQSWPVATANLEYAAVWGTLGPVALDVPRFADGVVSARISTLLEPAGRVDGPPVRLTENTGVAFQGCIVLGKGFILRPTEAAAWIKSNPANADVLFPYLNGEDLNSRPDTSASRWVIDFNDRDEATAQDYRLPYERVGDKVRSVRLANNRKVYRDYWWQYAEKRPAMRRAIARHDEVLVIARVSKAVTPLRVQIRQVPSEQVVVFATDSFADQAVLSSGLHQLWAITYGSTLETRVRYTPSDVFETFPRPMPTDRLAEVGKTLDTERREIMLRRDLGLTKLYNLVNDPDSDTDPDILRMRQIHVELDEAVMAAYGWSDVPLDHGFHTYRQMRRWTVSPAARVEILDLLLEENHRRAKAQGEAPPPAEGEDEITDDESGGDEE